MTVFDIGTVAGVIAFGPRAITSYRDLLVASVGLTSAKLDPSPPGMP